SKKSHLALGRIDRLAIDLKRGRLFVAELENDTVLKEALMLTTLVTISRQILTVCLALAALNGLPDCPSAQAAEVGVQGRWMYTTEVDGSTEAAQEMAATAAVEDDNVWLLLTCSPDRQTTVSIMHVEAFSYPLQSTVSLSLGVDTHPALTMS